MDRDIYAKIFMYVEIFFREGTLDWINEIKDTMPKLLAMWELFIQNQQLKTGPRQRAYIDKETGEPRIRLAEPKYHYNPTLRGDLDRFIREAKTTAN